MKIQFLLLTIFLIASCNKKSPKLYDDFHPAKFYYEGGRIEGFNVDIKKTFNSSIVIDSDTLVMTRDSIKGLLKAPFSPNKLNLKGKWFGKPFTENFKIEGSFIDHAHSPGGGTSVYTGTFSITTIRFYAID